MTSRNRTYRNRYTKRDNEDWKAPNIWSHHELSQLEDNSINTFNVLQVFRYDSIQIKRSREQCHVIQYMFIMDKFLYFFPNTFCAISQAGIYHLLTTEAWVQSKVRHFSECSVSAVNHHSANAPYSSNATLRLCNRPN